MLCCAHADNAPAGQHADWRHARGGDLGSTIGATVGHDDYVEVVRANAVRELCEKTPDDAGLVMRWNDNACHTE